MLLFKVALIMGSPIAFGLLMMRIIIGKSEAKDLPVNVDTDWGVSVNINKEIKSVLKHDAKCRELRRATMFKYSMVGYRP